MADTHHNDELAADDHHPHVVSTTFLVGVFVALLVLTVVTVLASYLDLGGRSTNIFVAVLIATVKATLVALFFMHLRWDKPFNAIVLVGSLGMVGLFLGISTLDMLEAIPERDREFSAEGIKRARDRLGPRPGHETGAADDEAAKQLIQQAQMFGALPAAFESKKNPATPAKVELGRMLYYETRLSKSHQISCNTCHDLAKFGDDGQKTSPGHRGQLGTRNSPTVYNAAGQSMQFWDGRAADVEQQALGPILNPVEMAMGSEDDVLSVLRSIPGYAEKFKAAFPEAQDPITYHNIGQAIGAFERLLVTPAPFDRFVEGDASALTPQQQKGLQTFMQVGCTACHMGPLFGGNIMQKLGLRKPWPDTKDQGKFEETGNPGDKMMFKTSQLRNIAKTAPYYHDGSVETLDEAVRLMADYQLGTQLTDEQTADIVAFLESLTGEVPADLIKEPELPPSGPDTPKPDPN